MEFTRRKIKIPKSLGETLRNARKKKEIELQEAEEETKVRSRYLKALEEERYQDLPETVYAAGFLAKYADFLELDKEQLVRQFMSERGRAKNGRLMVERKIKQPLFQFTPRFFVFSGIALALLGLLIYIGYSLYALTSPPNLVIASPNSEQIIKQENIEIVGKTDEGSTVTINNQPVVIDERGNFHQEVKLSSGLNSFEIRSINQLKKENVKIIKVLAEISNIETSNE